MRREPRCGARGTAERQPRRRHVKAHRRPEHSENAMSDTSTTSATETADVETVNGTDSGERPAPDKKELFHESEIAADYVEGLLDILDYDGDIDEMISAGRPVVEVVGGRLQALVGQRGATLEALQELTRLAVFRQTGTPSRLLLDVGGDPATPRKELAAGAQNAPGEGKEDGGGGQPGAVGALR